MHKEGGIKMAVGSEEKREMRVNEMKRERKRKKERKKEAGGGSD